MTAADIGHGSRASACTCNTTGCAVLARGDAASTPKSKTQTKSNKKTNKKPVVLSEEDRKRREAARKRIADARKAMAAQRRAALKAKQSASDTSLAAMNGQINVEIRAAAAPAASKSDILLSSSSNVDEDVTSSPVDMTSSSSLRTVETCGVQVASGGISQTHESSLVK